MAIIKATDDELRELVYEHACVFVAYISGTCSICQTLRPTIQILSSEIENQQIRFLEIDADENPVAKLETGEKQLPFIAIYKKGMLLECGTVSTDYEIEDMIKKLRKKKKRPHVN